MSKKKKTLIIVFSIIGGIILNAILIFGVYFIVKKSLNIINNTVNETIDYEDNTVNKAKEKIEKIIESATNQSVVNTYEGDLNDSNLTKDYTEQSILTNQECSGSLSIQYNMSIIDNSLVIVDINKGSNYTLKNITNAKKMVEFSPSFACDLNRYAILTEDGKVYISNIGVKSPMSLEYMDTLFNLTAENIEDKKIIDIGVVTYFNADGPNATISIILKLEDNSEVVLSVMNNYRNYFKVVEE